MFKLFCSVLLVSMFCIGSDLTAKNEEIPHETTAGNEVANFGAGCFTKVEPRFKKTPGVVSTMVGYSGGHIPHPTYSQVCSGTTGHAEVVRMEYDPEKISYAELLEVFWGVHDATQLDRQGPDVGRQYRSVIFYTTDEQNALAIESRKKAQVSLTKPIVTVITPAVTFYRAEEYHQQYIK